MPPHKIDPLGEYRAKRSAERTPEPFGRTAHVLSQRFVVQQHAARALHYDFRLEMDGVLRSWAIPKGPSPNPRDKRLAVQVEDHPLDYVDFEGVIPQGNYGAGAVIVWDRGVWVPLNDPAEGLVKGKLLFELKGYKLRGKWTLVKTRRNQKDWLMIKEKDGHTSDQGTEAFAQDSVLSGRTVHDLKQRADPAQAVSERLHQLGAKKNPISADRVALMLARSGIPFSNSGWLFEIKYDGYRLIAAREMGKARLYSRAGHDLSATFPEIAEVVNALPFEHFILDGEAVVHDERGLPSFDRLQKRGRLTRRADIERASITLPATLYAFDLLALGDFDLRALPLKTRKSVLKNILPSIGPIRFADHIEDQGELMYARVRALGLEGVIAKHADSPYIGGRSAQWIKFTVEKSDDFVVAGFTDPKGLQPLFGALLLAQYSEGEFHYAGRAGTGFSHKTLKEINAQLRSIESADAPQGAPSERSLHWIKPQLVCEVTFKGITPDGVLRQPVFVRLRDDKRPEECLSRLPLQQPVGIAQAQPVSPTVEKTVRFTNPEKVFWPQEGYTKGDLLDYHRAVAPWLLPYLADRPVVLTRYPDGITGKSFFQKDAPEFAPEWVRQERLWSEGSEREINYFIVEDVDSLLYIINLGTIPLHIWSSRLGSLERPDWCILDLDPKGAPFSDVVTIAKAIRRLCAEIALPSFVKTSGSSGLHVLVPLGCEYSYEQSRTLGELLARVMVAELPKLATVTRAIKAREGRVYIDYLQNGHGRLLVAPLSARPLPGATVSMPLSWHEVHGKLDAGRFTIKTALRRLHSLKTEPLRSIMDQKVDLRFALNALSKRFPVAQTR
ncbi:MAG: DNA ligase D [Gammaproteobacteria bacterium]